MCFFFCYCIISLSHCPLGWECVRERRRRCGGRQPGLGQGKVQFFNEFPGDRSSRKKMVQKQYPVLKGQVNEIHGKDNVDVCTNV